MMIIIIVVDKFPLVCLCVAGIQVEMALEALYNVIHNNAGVETQCNGHFKLLFSFFRFQGAKKLQMLTLKV